MADNQEALIQYVNTPSSPTQSTTIESLSRNRRVISRRFQIIPPEEGPHPIEPVRLTPVVRDVSSQRMVYITATTLTTLYTQLASTKEEFEKKLREAEKQNDELQQKLNALQRQLNDNHSTWLHAYHELAHSLPMTVINGEPGEEIHVELNRDNKTVIIRSRPPLEDNSEASSPKSPRRGWPHTTDF